MVARVHMVTGVTVVARVNVVVPVRVVTRVHMVPVVVMRVRRVVLMR